ncbi:MAG: AsmA family protein, partial [Flavobacteriales bacterium]|nr:AsmA family protein [Flavobacteriales bacterium]
MKSKLLKISAAVVGGIVLVVLGAMIIIPSVYKDEIIDAALKVAGENLDAHIEVEPENIDFSLFSSFPHFTLSASDIAIDGVGDFEGVRLVEAREIYAVVDVMSVFSGTPRIVSVGLDTPKINVIVNKKGKANYDIAKTPSVEAPVEEDDSTATSGELNIDLSKYAISDGYVSYVDSTSMMALKVAGLNHSGSGAMRSERFMLATRTSIDTLSFEMEGTRYVKDAHIKGSITLDMDMGAMVFTIDTGGEDYNLHVNDIPLLCEGSIAMKDNGMMDVDVHIGSGKTSFASLLAMVPPTYASYLDGVKTSGTFEMDGTIKGLYSSNSFPAIDIRLSANEGEIKYPSLPKSISDIFIDIAVKSPQSSSLDAMVVDMSRCDMSVAGAPIKASAYLATLMSDPYVKASLDAALDIATLKDVLPMEKEDKLSGRIDADVKIEGNISSLEKGRYDLFHADGSINIDGLLLSVKEMGAAVEIPKAQLVFAPAALELRSFDVKMGESDLSMVGDLRNYLGYILKDQTMKGSLKITASYIDVASFMPKSEEVVDPADIDNAGKEQVEQVESISVPARIDFDTRVDIKEVVYDDIKLNNISGNLGIKDERAYLKGIRTDVAKGSASLQGTYDTSGDGDAQIDMVFDIKNVDIPSMVAMFESVKTLAPIAEDLTGSVSGHIELETPINGNMEPVYTAMNSRGTLSTSELRLMENKRLKFVGKALGVQALEKDSKIKDLNMSYTITDGRLTIAPTTFDVAGIKAILSGDMTMV